MSNDLANSSSKAFPFGDVRELPWMYIKKENAVKNSFEDKTIAERV